MQKRGQIQSHALSYVLFAVIALAIVIFGIKAVTWVQASSYRTELTNFETQLGSDIQAMAFRVGAVRKFSYSFPRTILEVCFADLSADPDNSIGAVDMKRYPVISDSVHSKSKANMFLMGDSIQGTYYIGDIRISNNAVFTCFNALAGKLDLSIRGVANGPMITTEYRILAAYDPSAWTFTKIKFGTAVALTIPPGATTTPVDISIEEVPHTIINPTLKRVSETYKFGPSGTNFMKPITLTLQYYPELLGIDCPDTLSFYHYDDSGSLKESLDSSLIDCAAHTVNFSINSFSSGFVYLPTNKCPAKIQLEFNQDVYTVGDRFIVKVSVYNQNNKIVSYQKFYYTNNKDNTFLSAETGDDGYYTLDEYVKDATVQLYGPSTKFAVIAPKVGCESISALKTITFCYKECTAGQKQCSGNGYKTCETSSGCWKWGSVTACPAEQPCKDGACSGSACTRESDYAFCSRQFKSCGSVTASDNCGTSRTVASCGTCASGQTCSNGACSNSACTHESDSEFCSRLGKSCGSVTAADNCGTSKNVASCGTCASGKTCSNGACVPKCTDSDATSKYPSGYGSYDVKGTITGLRTPWDTSSTTLSDYCYPTDDYSAWAELFERWCGWDGVIRDDIHQCDHGCRDGACLQCPTNQCTPDAVRCSGNGNQRCLLDSRMCYSWGSVDECLPWQTCDVKDSMCWNIDGVIHTEDWLLQTKVFGQTKILAPDGSRWSIVGEWLELASSQIHEQSDIQTTPQMTVETLIHLGQDSHYFHWDVSLKTWVTGKYNPEVEIPITP